MLPLNSGTLFQVSQSALDQYHHFDGSTYGRARATVISSGNTDSDVYLAARLLGTAPNAVTVEFEDDGPGIEVTTTTVSQAGSAITVNLRRSTMAVLATAKEVADALNAAAAASKAFPLTAHYQGTGLGAVSAKTALYLDNNESGVDPNPAEYNSPWHWAPPVGQTFGLGVFYFENITETVRVRSVSFFFDVTAGSNHAYISKARLDPGGTLVANTKVPLVEPLLLTPSVKAGSFEMDVALFPGEVLLVETDTQVIGNVFVEAQRLAVFH